MSVVVIALVAAASVGAAVIVRDHPNWRLGGEATAPNRAAVAPRPAPTFRLVSDSSSESIYAVPASTFAVAVSAAHPCWVLMKSVPGGETLLSETLLPSVPHPPVTSNGDATISVAARAQSIVLSAGGRTIGTIATPVVGHTYLLDATR
jgi:hypothetical protein